MTKKDYTLIALVLSEVRRNAPWLESRKTIDKASELLARALATDNPRFHAGRFLEACDHSVIYKGENQ